MYSKVLLAVDGSENNKGAALEAIEICKAFGAKLTAAYVVTDAEVRPNAFGGDVSAEERKAIAEKGAEGAFEYVIAMANSKGVELQTSVLYGKPPEEIAKISGDYDLLVCGSLGRTGLSKAILGSVSSTLVKSAHCTVLVSRPKQ